MKAKTEFSEIELADLNLIRAAYDKNLAAMEELRKEQIRILHKYYERICPLHTGDVVLWSNLQKRKIKVRVSRVVTTRMSFGDARNGDFIVYFNHVRKNGTLSHQMHRTSYLDTFAPLEEETHG